MKNTDKENSQHTNCQSIEPLLYLKADELSIDEKTSLQHHLMQCQSCNKSHEEIQKLFDQTKFEPYTDQHDHLAGQIEKDIKLLLSPNSKPYQLFILTTNVKRLLVAASVLFFLTFSVEQVSTISRISKLEKRISQSTMASELVRQKGELLVINHFFSWDDIKSTAFSNLKSRYPEGISLISNSNKSWESWQKKLTPIEKRGLFIELVKKSSIKFPLIKMGELGRLPMNDSNF